MGKPSITRSAISAALNSLVQVSRKEQGFHELTHLLIVEMMVSDPQFPPIEHPREYALQTILITLISEKLNEARQFFGISQAHSGSSREVVIEFIAQDVRAGGLELIAWSILYHRFVLIDFSPSLEDLSRCYQIADKTLQRQLHFGVKLLTRVLSQKEWEARRANQSASLMMALPLRGKSKLFGRGALLEQIVQTIIIAPIKHGLITGHHGIGKTTLVEHVARQLIELDQVERIIWLSTPRTIEDIRLQLLSQLQAQDQSLPLRGLLAAHKTMIVLDDAEELWQNLRALHDFLSDVADAIVLIISSEANTLPPSVEFHFVVEELTLPAAEKLVTDTLYMIGQSPDNSTKDVARELYARFGGSPLALRLAATQWLTEEPYWVDNLVSAQTFGAVFDGLAEETQKLWCSLALFPRGAVETFTIEGFWGAPVPIKGLQLLQRKGVIYYVSAGTYQLIEPSIAFIRRAHLSHDKLKTMILHLLENFFNSDYSLRNPTIALEIAEHRWIGLDGEQFMAWLEIAWRTGSFATNNWLTFLELWEDMRSGISYSLNIAQAVCLRRIGRHYEAEQRLMNLVSVTGSLGRFSEQLEARIEWAVTKAKQSEYSVAEQILENAFRSLRKNDSQTRRRILLVLAQMAVEQNNAVRALTLLDPIQNETEAFLVVAEAYFLNGEYEKCEYFAQKLLIIANHDLRIRMQVYTLMGRANEVQGDLTTAYSMFTQALLLAQRLDDSFSLARIQTNLAAVFLQTGKYIEAHELLNEAYVTQRRMGDTTGLHSTQYNRQLLEQRIAG